MSGPEKSRFRFRCEVFLGFLRKKNGLDPYSKTSPGLFVIADEVRLLLLAGSVTVQLKDLSASILQNGGLVDSGTGTSMLGLVALLQ